MYIADISDTTAPAVGWNTSRNTSPCLDIGSIFGIIEGQVTSRDVLDVLESVVVLSNRSKSDTVSIVQNGVFNQNIGAVRFRRDGIVAILAGPSPEGDVVRIDRVGAIGIVQ